MPIFFGDRVRSARKAAGLTQRQLADKLGVANTSISNWEKDLSRPGPDTIAELCGVLNITPNYLMSGEDSPIPPGFEPLPEMVKLPLVGSIACGEPILAEQNIEDYIAVPAYWHATFTLRCRGDSMEPTVHDGDLVAIRKDAEFVDGQIYAVRIGEEARLKRIYRHPGQLILQSENPAYPPDAYSGPQLEEITIEGQAVGFCRNL